MDSSSVGWPLPAPPPSDLPLALLHQVPTEQTHSYDPYRHRKHNDKLQCYDIVVVVVVVVEGRTREGPFTMAHLLADDGDLREVLGQRGADALLSQSVCQSLKVIRSSLSFRTRTTSW